MGMLTEIVKFRNKIILNNLCSIARNSREHLITSCNTYAMYLPFFGVRVFPDNVQNLICFTPQLTMTFSWYGSNWQSRIWHEQRVHNDVGWLFTMVFYLYRENFNGLRAMATNMTFPYIYTISLLLQCILIGYTAGANTGVSWLKTIVKANILFC